MNTRAARRAAAALAATFAVLLPAAPAAATTPPTNENIRGDRRDPAGDAPNPFDVLVVRVDAGQSPQDTGAEVTITFAGSGDVADWPSGTGYRFELDTDTGDGETDFVYAIWNDGGQPTSMLLAGSGCLFQPFDFGPEKPHEAWFLVLGPCFPASDAFSWRLVAGEVTGFGEFDNPAERVPDTGWNGPISTAANPSGWNNADITTNTPYRTFDSRGDATGRLPSVKLTGGVTYRVHALAIQSGEPGQPPRSPAGAVGAVLNVTVTEPAAAGYVSLWPCTSESDPAPATSNVNYDAGVTIANQVIVGAVDGHVCVRSLVDTHLVIDATGWIPAGSSVHPFAPKRLADTRAGHSTSDGAVAATGRVAAGGVLEVPVVGRAGVPAGATAAVVNVTAVGPSGPGYVTVYPCGQSRPHASNLNYTAGQVAAVSAVAKLSADGKVCVYTLAAADIVVDVAGYAAESPAFEPVTPVRLADTRSGAETFDGASAGTGRASVEQVLRVPVAGRSGLPLEATGVQLTVTAVLPDAPGYVTIWPCDTGYGIPWVSTVNFGAGTVVANAATVALGALGDVCVTTSTGADVLVDLTGVLVRPPSGPPG